MEKPKYYKFIKKNENDFTFKRIYKIKNVNDLNDFGNFIDDRGRENGYSSNNHLYFIPATEKEYFIQEGIIIPIFNYNKLINILNFINNYGKTI